MKLSALNVVKTPAGAASSAAGLISLIVNVILPPVWPWLAHQSPTWRGGVVTVLIFAGAYLGVAWKVARAEGQKLTLVAKGLRIRQLPTKPAHPLEVQADAPTKVES